MIVEVALAAILAPSPTAAPDRLQALCAIVKDRVPHMRIVAMAAGQISRDLTDPGTVGVAATDGARGPVVKEAAAMASDVEKSEAKIADDLVQQWERSCASNPP